MEEHADQRLTTPVFVQITSLAYFVRQKYVIQNVKIILTAPTVLVSAILDLLEKTVMNLMVQVSGKSFGTVYTPMILLLITKVATVHLCWKVITLTMPTYQLARIVSHKMKVIVSV